MDPQIHGALVGGGLAGVTAAGAVVLDIRLRARLDRKQRLEAAVQELAMLTRVTGMAIQAGDHAFSQQYARLAEQLPVVHRLARTRRTRPIREAASDLSDMWTAALLRASEGKSLTDVDLIVMAMPLRRMHVCLYGQRVDRVGGIGGERVGRYVRDGISAPEVERKDR